MLNKQDLEKLIDNWDFPLGPFRSVEDVYEDMDETARELGPAYAAPLAELAAAYGRQQHKREQVMQIFLEKYGEHYPAELSKALLSSMDAKGPAILLYILGTTGGTDALLQAKSILDIEHANEELLVAWACFLGDVGGQEAISQLNSLNSRTGLPASVKSEVEIAIQNANLSRK